MKSYSIFLLSLLVLPFSLCGQNASLFAKLPGDKANIIDYKHQLTLRLYSVTERISLDLNPLAEGPNLKFNPHTEPGIGIAAFYKWFGFGLALRMPTPESDADKYGTSSEIDLRLNAYGSWINGELAFASYQGFYLSNTGELQENFGNNDPYLQRADLNIRTISAIIYLVPNYKNHSFRAAYIQNESQKQGSGSLVIAPAFQFFRLNADSSLMPVEYEQAYDVFEQDRVARGRFASVGVFAGYSYTFVLFKKAYLNLGLMPGAFIQYYNYQSDQSHFTRNNAYLLWTTRFAAGYNGNKWFMGMGGVTGFNNANIPFKDTGLSLGMQQFRAWIGMRLNVQRKQKLQKQD